ncbi:MAG: hypothetical protein H6834_06665 [Planctomycetes bacterium]|nr:hypothetical protein [Planctomycetota bacterium]MCB9891800.1 hypothetical protein [Planctomycetota bacterium]
MKKVLLAMGVVVGSIFALFCGGCGIVVLADMLTSSGSEHRSDLMVVPVVLGIVPGVTGLIIAISCWIALRRMDRENASDSSWHRRRRHD